MNGKILVISNGNVGSAIADKLEEIGCLVYLYSRNYDKTVEEYKDTSVHVIEKMEDAVAKTDLVIFATRDEYINDMAKIIAESNVDIHDKKFIHLSGVMKSDILNCLKEKKAFIGSLHPLQTFPQKHLSKSLENISFAFEGDEELIPMINHIVAKINSSVLRIKSEDKILYHIAAVFSSNLQMALFNISDRILKDIGIEEGVYIHKKIIETTIKNLFEYGPQKGLSGPVKRGDISTIKKHLLAVEDLEIRKIYALLSKEANRMNKSNSSKKIEKILDDVIEK